MRIRSIRMFGVLILGGLPLPAAAQVVQTSAQYPLPADYNGAFYEQHEAAARSFYAAHVAHFSVYEEGMNRTGSLAPRVAEAEARVRALIRQPPKYEPPIEVTAPLWSRTAHATAAAMEWTHHLHEQLYDILTDDRIVDRQAAGERAIAHYLSRENAAFSTRGYGHSFMMGGGEWAGGFAREYPSMNGILWAYHWHHAAIYEALMEETPEARSRELDRALRLFEDSVLVNPPEYMPLTAEIAPRFGAMFPAAAHIFDNLHMMHDVVNDIMTDLRLTADQRVAETDRMLVSMRYRAQDWVVPPVIDMEVMMEHMPGMPMQAMTVPTRLPDGRWLPQGHPDAALPEGMQHQHHEEGSR